MKNEILAEILVFSNTDTLTPEIVLNGHIDVVDAKTELFIPKIKNSRLYGRGEAGISHGATYNVNSIVLDMD
ncbi:MAG: hypothetical protein OIN88_00475 [Candidatus Methanoperedens sp.]|nr:hypothetical protein [Candidatus Methanoperedens sp.]HLB70476.1 hypothetical protein [Candidatus Methanoperedens sp.]